MSYLFGAPLAVTVLLSFITALFVAGYHYSQVGQPFKNLSADVRTKLIDNYMKQYHPKIDYEYYRGKKDAKSFIKNTTLINPNVIDEEDVITGHYKNAQFYLSEIDLKKKTNNSSIRIFKGMLFHFKIPGRKFPRSRIQSKIGMLKRVVNGFRANETYGFHYDTENLKQFQESLGPLFPFIEHLIKQQGDLRIETRNDEILILLESKVKFLDEPRQNIHKSFDDPEYYANIVKQLNSFLYIVEAFTNDVESSEIEETLELKMLDILKKEEKRR